MQRPTLNPTLFEDRFEPQPKKPRSRRWLIMLKWSWRIVRLVGKVLLSNIFRPKNAIVVEEGTRTTRILRAIGYRAAFVPVLLTFVVAALVFAATHSPTPVSPSRLPDTLNLYYEPVSFVTPDGQRLEANLVPVLTAKTVLEQKDKALRQKHPAVVLVHDVDATWEQMVPMVMPLHDAGFVVLILSTRGAVSSERSGQTFGLREATDVEAAVEMLRRRPFVDENKVTVVGRGAGANAALMAFARDEKKSILAVVLDGPLNSSQDILDHFVKGTMLGWMKPLCKWGFELAYGVDAEDLNLDRYRDTLAERPHLKFDRIPGPGSCLSSTELKTVIHFLKSQTQESFADTN
jgi:pimeloyl-ACP methyl ester carboxylesterase